MLRNADVAMYHAKRAGGGRYAVFEPTMHAARLSRLGLDTELRHAIERGELVLHYQPLYDLSSGQLAAFESLVRWRHRERGLIPPLEWIPLAEETGLIVEVDRWVLEEACRQFAAWWRVAPISMSVNVCAQDLRQPGYPSIVEQAIAGRFPASALILEATESVSLQESEVVVSQLEAVKELGVRVALDDFGTGYATLLSLAQLPIDVLKIARPFVVAAAEGCGKGRGLLAGIIDTGRHLGVKMVGEGIETERQRALLAELGCDLGQGFMLGRPLVPAAAEALLEPDAVLG
jgi:EAL domain-containing protein (putative c-di-GMP-specific phosphodiesterase class I)